MTGKLKLYIGLLVLGLVVIGGGIWMLAKSPPKIDIPEGNPVICEQLEYVMRGEFSYLYFYGDGSILYIEEKGLREPSLLHPPTRTWRTARFRPDQLDSLLAYFENSGLDELYEDYYFPGAVLGSGDMRLTITVNSDNLSKTVTAFGYPTPSGMPAPLNAIYGRLRTISEVTEEVYRENIKD